MAAESFHDVSPFLTKEGMTITLHHMSRPCYYVSPLANDAALKLRLSPMARPYYSLLLQPHSFPTTKTLLRWPLPSMQPWWQLSIKAPLGYMD
jgi:hypothetical protein